MKNVRVVFVHGDNEPVTRAKAAEALGLDDTMYAISRGYEGGYVITLYTDRELTGEEADALVETMYENEDRFVTNDPNAEAIFEGCEPVSLDGIDFVAAFVTEDYR